MEEKNPLPYRPPVITRVVLKKEQAVLSVCSDGTTLGENGGGVDCASGYCKNYSMSGGGSGPNLS